MKGASSLQFNPQHKQPREALPLQASVASICNSIVKPILKPPAVLFIPKNTIVLALSVNPRNRLPKLA
jgi:hypothetical protein